MDELMVPFKSRKNEWNHIQGAIAIYKIKRSLKGISLQFKGMIDCSSKIMMRLELCEGKGQGQTEFEDKVGPSAAVVLRLTEPWFESGRVVVGDCAFSSVSLAVELQAQGLHYIGSLKTSTARFPIKKLSNMPLKRGKTFAMKAEDPVSGHKVLAVAWKDKGKKPKTIVATCGSTDDGKPSLRYKWKLYHSLKTLSIYPVREQISVPRSDVVARNFDNFHWLDVHDHLRQGILRLHEVWKTRDWLKRVWATVLGIIFTDAYFVWLKLNGFEARDKKYIDFIDRLAVQLLKKDQRETRSSKRPKKKQKVPVSSSSSSIEVPITMKIAGTSKYAEKTKRSQLRCVQCGQRSSHCCKLCEEDPELDEVLGICQSTSTPCFILHLAKWHQSKLVQLGLPQ